MKITVLLVFIIAFADAFYLDDRVGRQRRETNETEIKKEKEDGQEKVFAEIEVDGVQIKIINFIIINRFMENIEYFFFTIGNSRK